MQAGDNCGTNSVAQGKQVCHCEGALRPWQSRSTRSDNRKASGEYGSVTQRGVEDAAPYKACAVDIVHGNLQLPKALNPRKGDAASVRRQSRQRLRSERRYRRNRLVRFCRQPVRIASAPPGGACLSPTTRRRCPDHTTKTGTRRVRCVPVFSAAYSAAGMGLPRRLYMVFFTARRMFS